MLKKKVQEFGKVMLDNKISLNLPHCMKCLLRTLVVLSQTLWIFAAVQFQLLQKCISVSLLEYFKGQLSSTSDV